MLRQILFVLLIHALLRAVVAKNATPADNSRNLIFTTEDALPANELSRLTEADAETRFIGDLVIGQRQQEETLFWRSLEIDNPTNDVYGQEIALAVTNGVIHYISVINDRGSYAVACDRPYALGSSRSSFNIRVTPNSHSYVTVVVGAH
ncbi:uncharacterized protein LOC107265070 isoform X2 [Cephus cinctus]|uniref:Uncharacterized protein LOC107265070 isoform X2 n=1 Tax=Cephus cinctus TaxID=211228 RepID=A0AAJ7FFQ6_CEPCN|nr:uncharacterized protein LOC107265070 isoform X2 [Cephus cinctus]